MADIRSLVSQENVMTRLQEILGKNASVFATSVVQLVNQSSMLSKCDPKTVLNAAMTAATLNLQLNNQLGYAYVIPYGNTAQFQIGYKGLIQLAQRSSQYRKINAIPVYENQFRSWNPLQEVLDGDFSLPGEGEPIGYAAYFLLSNGFHKMDFWTIDRVRAHAQTYSKSYKSGPWKTNFNSMACKTVLKLLLNTYGPLSIEMQKAIQFDQSVQLNPGMPVYPDNPGTDENGNTAPVVSNEAILEMIKKSDNLDELEMLMETHKAEITKDIQLTAAFGKRKGNLEDGQ